MAPAPVTAPRMVQSRHAPFEFWNPTSVIKSAEFAALCCTARVDFKEVDAETAGKTLTGAFFKLREEVHTLTSEAESY